MRKLIGLLVALGLFSSTPLLEAQVAAKPPMCPNANSTAEMLDCASKEFKKEDAQLNQLYQGLMKYLGAKDQERLKVSQRAWLEYKTKNCEFYTGLNEGGSLAPVSGTLCQADMTQMRNKELSAELEQMKATKVPEAKAAK